MKEFSDIRELFGQIGLDLEAKTGQIGRTFRNNIRDELNNLGDKKAYNISIQQTKYGTMVSLKIEDWVDQLQRTTIIEEFKDLMDRIGATNTGTCTGTMPPNLVSLLRTD